MPLRVSHQQQAWVKTAPKPKSKSKPKPVDPAVAREILCAPLRYFACRPMDGGDRVRMLERTFKGEDGMVEVDRAPSPVQDQWQGAGLMFHNGTRTGTRKPRKITARERERGFDEDFFSDDPVPRPMPRIVSEPVIHVRLKTRAPSETTESLAESDNEQTILDDDQVSRRSYRAHRSHRPIPEPDVQEAPKLEPKPEPVREPLPAAPAFQTQDTYREATNITSLVPQPRPCSPARSVISSISTHRPCRNCEPPPNVRAPPVRKVCHSCRSPVPPSTVDSDETKSYRSASPPPPSVYRARQRTPPPAEVRRSYQSRTFTAPAAVPPTRSSRPTQRPTSTFPSNSGYQFQSAIFQSRSQGNSYRDVYSRRSKDGMVGPPSWASATSALSFD